MHHLHLPATHNRGSTPIDGIFIPITLLEHCQTGYLAFGEAVPSDHQAVWIDIPAHRVCPTEPEVITRSKACWLQCKDLHIIEKYNQLSWEQLEKMGIAGQAHVLLLETKSHFTQTQQQEYEKIDQAATKYKQYAENHCRKIHAGMIPWCPWVSRAINHILYWKGLWSRLTGCTISSSVLRQRARKET